MNDGRFPKFEGYLNKGYKSPYLEDNEPAADVAVGIAILLAAMVLLIVALMSRDNVLLWALVILVFLVGISMIYRGVRKKLRLRDEYGFHGISRAKMSTFVLLLDTLVSQDEDIEVLSPYGEEGIRRGAKEIHASGELLEMLDVLSEFIEWPCSCLHRVEDSIGPTKRFFNRAIECHAILIVSLIGLGWVFDQILGFLFISIFTLPCFFSFLAARLKVNAERLRNVRCNEGMSIEESMSELLDLLKTTYRWPLRFYLNRDYDGLVYTSRTKIGPDFIQRKEAIFYPPETDSS